MMLDCIRNHKFFGLPRVKPRVWVDLSSVVSKRVGLAMHSPGRKVLRWAVRFLRLFAWLPIEKIVTGPVKRFYELDGHEVIEKAVRAPIEFLTLYMGNDSAKTKFTVLVRLSRSGESKLNRDIIVKLGRTPEAGEAIRKEVDVLKRLMATPLCAQVPVVQGDVGTFENWTWSVQTVLPKGRSPVRMQKEHYEFLEELKKLGISHGDFAPWNCSIVSGKLFVYDWEDAEPWENGKDEAWFKKQVEELLGVK